MADEKQVLGYPLRQKLFAGEDKFFKERPEVAGMAAEDGSIILNPYSTLSPKELEAVTVNEALRLHMRDGNIVPKIKVTPEQEQVFKGTEYENADVEKRQTIISRILTGDPSVSATPEQQKEAARIQRMVDERVMWNEEAAKRGDE